MQEEDGVCDNCETINYGENLRFCEWCFGIFCMSCIDEHYKDNPKHKESRYI